MRNIYNIPTTHKTNKFKDKYLTYMKKDITLILPPEVAFDEQRFIESVKKQLKISPSDQISIRPMRRSIDARSRKVKVNVSAEVFIGEVPPPLITYHKDYPDVSHRPQVVIVGAGPAGLFAALRLIELGFKPVVIERGKDVRSRRRDLAAINKEHIVNPDSNYCFGEGGAGTYSDGKLYTRSKKRGDVKRILEILVAHGATTDILIEAHPHIGTNKLPKIVTDLRESIIQAGGIVIFDTRVTDLIIHNETIEGIITHTGDRITGLGVILATGHSARDIFHLLDQKKIIIAPKPFALGVRVEHAQQLIDKIQYRSADRGNYLPASSYSLVDQVAYEGKQRGVFSFCMCPGGFIVPAATAPGEIVVNGMSPSRRDSKFANSGIVVAVDVEDLKSYEHHGPLAGMYLQQQVEQKACTIAGGTQVAPAQRLLDFVEDKVSKSLLETSYQPGLFSTDMRKVLPEGISLRLQEAFKAFGRKMKGYLSNEAQIVGVESRTSSPVSIPRDRQTFEHVQIKRFFPCGEGAGYAGGIVSAAMDGERCAEKLITKYKTEVPQG